MKRHLSRLGLLSLLLSLTLACGAKHPIHQGAVNQFDSNSADALTIWQADLNQAKDNIAKGLWPKDWAPQVDKAGGVYNTALASYKTWRDVASGVKTGDQQLLLTKFQSDLNELADAITALFAKAGQKPPQVPK